MQIKVFDVLKDAFKTKSKLPREMTMGERWEEDGDDFFEITPLGLKGKQDDD